MMEHDDRRLRLCVVTDDLRDGVSGLTDRVCAAARGGATLVVLRLKHADARTLVEAGRALVAALTIPVLVSERLDVALACGASGVHLSTGSAGSMPVIAVRSQCTAGMLVAASVSVDDDVRLVEAADFVTIGPVLGAGDSSLGVEGFRRLAAACGRPAIAIGGIGPGEAEAVRRAGAAGIAVIGQVMGAADPEAAASLLLASV